MVKHNNTLNYNLHEFFGESAIREQLYELFVEFSLRSLPLPSKEITFSGRFIEMKKQFDILIEKTTILYVEVDKKIFCFGSFGSDFSDLNIPDSKQYLNDPQKSREFTFSASRANQLFLAQKSAHDMFKYMKEKYGIQHIIGHIVREKKRNKFFSAVKRIFKFNIINDFVYYEIP
jgi:hypothetical protein